MSETTTVAMPKEIAPYEKVEISVKMIAPSSPGSYRSYWKLRTADGKLFGVGINYSETIWVDITVQSSMALGESTPTESSSLVNDVQLDVDNKSVVSACPYTFLFTGHFLIALHNYFTIKFVSIAVITSFSFGLLSAIINVIATSALSAIRLFPSLS